MKIRLRDPTLLPELLGFLRERGCIAYYEAGAEAIEALLPHASGEQETRELRSLLDGWSAAHREAAVATTD